MTWLKSAYICKISSANEANAIISAFIICTEKCCWGLSIDWANKFGAWLKVIFPVLIEKTVIIVFIAQICLRQNCLNGPDIHKGKI